MFDDIQEDQKTTFKSSLADEPDSSQIQENQNNADNLNYLDGATQQQTESNQIFGKEKSDSEPEDIFDEIHDDVNNQEKDYINRPPNVKLVANFGQGEEEEEMPGISGKKNSKIKIIIIIVIVFLMAIGAAWLAYVYFIKSNPDSAVERNKIEISAINDLPAPANVDNQNLDKNINNNNQNTSETVKPIDTDGDGLTDDNEIKFGTDPKLSDTDGDGLTDQEEVIKYKTNPHNIDSDSDGYIDGEEVKNGYNPAGFGKLIDRVELP